MTMSPENAFADLLQLSLGKNPLFQDMPDMKMADMSAVSTAMQQAASTWSNMDMTTLERQGQTWMRYQNDMMQAWMEAFIPGRQGEAEDDNPRRKDARFKAPEWDQGIFKYLHTTYGLTANYLKNMADQASLPDHQQKQASFYTRQILDALAPSNFAHTNPEVLQQARETGGKSLIAGLNNLLADMRKGYITTTDETVFKVGENLATTPGAVVYRNDMIELIHYKPMVETIAAEPVLIIPPCVNKFYIFDLNEKKSMIKYLLEQGQNVFIMSWRNPSPGAQDWHWDDYIAKGIFQALETTVEIAGAKRANLLSWCNGGTMLIAALAVLPAELREKIATATFLSSMIDFSNPGDIGVFIDQAQVDSYNQRLKTSSVAPGHDISRAMAMLHANESIWHFVVQNYLLGKTPPPFDILYWNSDTSNLPTAWYAFFIEKMYLQNLLREPGALTLLGKPVDTRNIDVPCYFLAASADHIVPWISSYSATELVSGDATFVLTDGGHVSGTVINHPVRNRKSFYTGADHPEDPQAWLASATKNEGSWWPHWLEWIKQYDTSGTKKAPKQLGNKAHPPMEAAPGTFVHEKVRQDGLPFAGN